MLSPFPRLYRNDPQNHCLTPGTLETCQVHIYHVTVPLFSVVTVVIFIFLRFSPEKGIAVFYVMSHGFALIWLEVEFASNFKNLFLDISLCSEPLIGTRLTHQLRFECPCDVADFISIHRRGHRGRENSGKELRQLLSGGFQSQPRAAVTPEPFSVRLFSF